MAISKITPHLWFDNSAREAAEFYVSAFPGSRVTSAGVIRDTPSGDCDVISFELSDQPFMAINAGPLFKFNPSVSFMVNFDPAKDAAARAHLDRLWEQLSDGGSALTPLDAYPFSQHYGWVQDKYGLSWQLILTNPSGEMRPAIVPALMFTSAVAGRAEEAIAFYCSVFKDSTRGTTVRYAKGMEPHQEGTVMFADFLLETHGWPPWTALQFTTSRSARPSRCSFPASRRRRSTISGSGSPPTHGRSSVAGSRTNLGFHGRCGRLPWAT
jgi:predicted 3-demethylubiquinone-9 3-methyltransferase (glyoxalase superfamily)